MKTAQDLVTAAKTEITEISIEDAEQAIDSANVLLDVREPDEFRDGHIPGAINVPRGLLEFKLSSEPTLRDRSLSFILYCKTSGRAAL